MKVLISTANLARQLAKIKFDEEHVSHCKIEEETLTLYTQTSAIEIACVAPVEIDFLWQNDRRWDWIFEIVNRVEDYPAVLEIDERSVHLIFDV